jgi:hypothetical protein
MSNLELLSDSSMAMIDGAMAAPAKAPAVDWRNDLRDVWFSVKIMNINV